MIFRDMFKKKVMHNATLINSNDVCHTQRHLYFESHTTIITYTLSMFPKSCCHTGNYCNVLKIHMNKPNKWRCDIFFLPYFGQLYKVKSSNQSHRLDYGVYNCSHCCHFLLELCDTCHSTKLLGFILLYVSKYNIFIVHIQ